jgi:flagellar biosynthesis anti-sigma factor FlgM
MKINPNNGIANQAINDRSSVNAGSGKVASSQGASVDRTTLSSPLPTVSSLVKQAMQFPAVRQDKVSSLRDAVSSGSYELDSRKIADAIASESSR